jgi:chemotaxis protein CheD
MSGFGSSGMQSGSAKRVVVSVGEAEISSETDAIISTFALGSCVGVVAYDADAQVGGLLHIMLPDSKISPDRAQEQPLLFADTGIAKFIQLLEEKGADRANLKLLIAGGASVISTSDRFKIGDQNVNAVKELIAAENLEIVYEDLGGLTHYT